MRKILVTGLLALSLFGFTPQSSPQSSARSEELLRVGVTEVLLDVIITDKKGRQIKDLRPEEFEVFEDGVPQKVTASHLIGSGVEANEVQKESSSQGKLRPQSEAGLPKVARQINLVTLVFDRISPYGRQMARDAAKEYFRDLRPADFVSVMAIDRALRVLQPFTNDAARLNAAVSLAVDGTPQQFADASNAVREAIQQSQESSEAADAAFGAGGRNSQPGPPAGAAASDAKLNQVIGDMLRQTSVGEETIQGRATVEALMNIIRGEQAYPGRKAVVFFAERVALPTQVIGRFRDLISAANRANVSFYCIDATGLNSQGELQQMSQELNSLASISQRQMRKRSGAVSREEATLTENTEDVLRKSNQNSLADLAESTGGILISNTNDLRSGLRRVSEDLSSHYELSYTPTNTVYNGAFRRIEVKVKRPGLIARGRQGYYAVRSTDATVGSFEIPMLAAMEAKVLPRELTCRSSSLLFPTKGAKTEAILYLEIPLLDFSFSIDNSKKEYEAKVAVLVTVRNSAGRMIEKFSQEFPFRGPKEKVAETQQRNLLFYRTADLAPGRYTMEVAVRDALSGKTTVKRSVVMVPAKTAHSMALSSVVVVKRLDSSRADSDLQENPLLFDKQMIIPHLKPEVNTKDWPQLAFYFVVVPPVGEQAEATVDLIVSKDGKPVGHMGERPLPAPDGKGRIPYLASLPLSSFDNGAYDVNVLVSRAGTTTSGSVGFSIQ
jgi:VWFA-related protein